MSRRMRPRRATLSAPRIAGMAMQARRILSLDGGGIRGYLSARWLQAVDAALVGAGKPPLPEAFDLVAGSSTGAIVACAIGIGMPPAHLAQLYRRHGDTIFPGMATRLWSRAGRLFTQGPSAPRYDGIGLERVLAQEFGDRAFGSLARPTLVTAYDTLSRRAIIFKSFKPEHAGLRIRDVLRASCAAPTYFPAHPLRVEERDCVLVDGGVVANNPTACAIAEALRKDLRVHDSHELVVLSVGTGERNRPITLREAREWGALEWATPIIDVLFDGSTDAVDYIAAQLVGDGYVRLQAELNVGLDDLDDTSATNFLALDALAADYLARDTTRAAIARLVTMV